jgi:hypothetical protein
LYFTSRKSARLTVQAQIVKSHLRQIGKSSDNFSENQLGSGVSLEDRCHIQKKSQNPADGQLVNLGNVLTTDAVEERLRLEATAIARSAGAVGTVAREKNPNMHLVGFGFEPAKETADPIKPIAFFDDCCLLGWG